MRYVQHVGVLYPVLDTKIVKVDVEEVPKRPSNKEMGNPLPPLTMIVGVDLQTFVVASVNCYYVIGQKMIQKTHDNSRMSHYDIMRRLIYCFDPSTDMTDSLELEHRMASKNPRRIRPIVSYGHPIYYNLIEQRLKRRRRGANLDIGLPLFMKG